jgi:hypothetical protein
VAKKLTVFEYERQLKREYAEKMADWTLSKEERRKADEDYVKAVRELHCRYGNRIGDACAQSDGFLCFRDKRECDMFTEKGKAICEKFRVFNERFGV